MNDFQATICRINKLDFLNFCIPEYQRPYVWGAKETRQLWDDILVSMQLKKSAYRIGTIIIHDNPETKSLDIVDGQQRMTTLSLLIFLLGHRLEIAVNNEFLERKQFFHRISLENIKNNIEEIRQWIKDELLSPEELLNYILEKCSVVEIRVRDVSEAFQMFDSQNGRGLPLEAYNLLKAFHMRYTDKADEESRIRYDRIWEETAKGEKGKDYLKQIIDEQLYRLRTWSKSRPAYSFTKSDIEEFKGFSPDTIKYPYQNYLNYYLNHMNEKQVYRLQPEHSQTYTQVNQYIVNGPSFFDYIQSYVAMYKLLFEKNGDFEELGPFRTFYDTYCLPLTKKKGDQYLTELYKSIMLLVFDKFGTLGLNRYYKSLYAYVYRLRLEKKYVRYNSVAEYPLKVIAKIHHAKELLDLNFIKADALAPILRQQNNLNNSIVEEFFKKETKVEIR